MRAAPERRNDGDLEAGRLSVAGALQEVPDNDRAVRSDEEAGMKEAPSPASEIGPVLHRESELKELVRLVERYPREVTQLQMQRNLRLAREYTNGN